MPKRARARAPEPKPAPSIRTFNCDRRSNPKLHNMYVREAYADLQVVGKAIAELGERSRVPAIIMAGALHEAMQKEIEEDAAFFEAAALLFAGLDPPKEEE